MLVCTSWKARPHIFSDGSGGFTVSRVKDETAADAMGLETTLALGEFLEFDTRLVHDLDAAMPAITAAMERVNG